MNSEKSLRSQVIDLAWPAVLQGLLSVIILFTDRLILGAHSGAALASMQVSGPITWSLFSLFGAFSVGVLAVIGRAIGARQENKASDTYGTAICISLVLGVAVGLLGFFSREAISSFLLGERAAESAAKELAEIYLGPVFLSGPLIILSTVTVVAFQASGDTRTPMWLTVIGGTSNLVISWVLVFGKFGFPELGILGASIGTVSATLSSAVIGLILIHYRNSRIRIVGPTVAAFRSIMKIAWPAFGEKFLFHTGFLIFAAYIGRLGDLEMTAHQAMIAIESLGFIPSHAFGVAAATLVAQQLGAGSPRKAEAAAHFSARLGFVTLSLIGLFFFFCSHFLVGLFSDDPEVIALGASCMTIAAVAQPLIAISDVYGAALRGAGDTRTPLKVAILGPLIVRPISCYLLAFEFGYGLFGIWLGSTLDWIVRSSLLYIAFIRGKWKSIEID